MKIKIGNWEIIVRQRTALVRAMESMNTRAYHAELQARKASTTAALTRWVNRLH